MLIKKQSLTNISSRAYRKNNGSDGLNIIQSVKVQIREDVEEHTKTATLETNL